MGIPLMVILLLVQGIIMQRTHARFLRQGKIPNVAVAGDLPTKRGALLLQKFQALDHYAFSAKVLYVFPVHTPGVRFPRRGHCRLSVTQMAKLWPSHSTRKASGVCCSVRIN